MLSRHIGGVIALAAVLGFVPLNCRPRPREEPRPAPRLAPAPETIARRPVRVLLVDDVKEARVGVAGPYEVRRPGSAEVLERGAKLASTAVRAAPGGIALGGRHYPWRILDLRPAAAAPVEVEGQRYRGLLRIIARPDDRVRVVNVVGLEAYLAGVLAGEMPPHWPIAALKAQAVAARTYALYQAARRRTASADYDLTSDQRSQVYLGLSGETPRTRRAVDETAGIVLTWRGRLFSTYYSSTCGGHTLAGRFLFKDGAIPPLDGVECPYCRGTKYAHWERTFSIAELTRGVNEYLSADGRTVGEVKQLQVLERAPSGHVLKVRVVGSSGTVDLSGKAFRKALGTMRLPSTRFHLEPARGGLRLVGSGFGHGVGLCQVGARGAARAGLDFLDILQYYYPHSRPVRISSAPDRGSG